MNNNNTQRNSLSHKITLWADILRDCSAMGLHFASNVYEQDRYQKIQDIALEMLALASARPIEQIEPLRATVFARPTPISVSDAAIIDDQGKILLIRRTDNGLWAMPGGILDVGETPAQGAVREALEETGVSCEPVALVGIYDSRFCGTISYYQMYQFSFLCHLRPDVEVIDPPPHAHEILEKRWFSENALPDDIDPGHISRIPEAFRVWHGDQRAYFDRIG